MKADLRKKLLSGWRPYFWIAAWISLLYGQTVFFGYTGFDDILLTVSRQGEIGKASNLAEAFKSDAFGGDAGAYYRPVMTISFMLDSLWGGVKPGVFHLSNLLLHICACWLLFSLLGHLGHQKTGALAGAFLFAAHPALAQAVVWIPGRNDILLAIFLLASFLGFLKYLGTGKNIFYLGHLAFLTLALFSKETAFLMPALFLVYYLLADPENRKPGRLAWLALGWGLCCLLYFFAWNFLAPAPALTGGRLFNSMPDNLTGLLSYAGKAVFPAGLSPLPVPRDINRFCGGLAAVLFGSAAFWGGVRSKKKFLFGLLWFLALITPAFLKSPSSAYFLEHRLYLPLAGLIIMLLELKVLRSDKFPRAVRIIVVLSIASFGMLAAMHAGNYKKDLKFWEYAVKASPHSAVAWCALGQIRMERGEAAAARQNLQRALELDQGYAPAHNNLGFVHLKSGRLDSAEAEFHTALRLVPDYAEARNNLGTLLVQRGKLEEAAGQFKMAIGLNPKKANYYTSLGMVLFRQNNYRQAKDNYLLALALSPRNPRLLSDVSYIYFSEGNLDSSRFYYHLAVKNGLTPDETILKKLDSP
jgi:Tfp pilus assembly protein PilF